MLTNPTLPGICKIGQTRRSASLRAREVSRSYGTALPFEVASRHAVPDAAAIEWIAHRKLRRFRLPASELFEVHPERAAVAIQAAVLAYRPPSRRWRWLRRLLTPKPRHDVPWRRFRRGDNWLPLLFVLAIAAAGVVWLRPAVPVWAPAPIARVILRLERF